jgi:hypothetical protein
MVAHGTPTNFFFQQIFLVLVHRRCLWEIKYRRRTRQQLDAVVLTFFFVCVFTCGWRRRGLILLTSVLCVVVMLLCCCWCLVPCRTHRKCWRLWCLFNFLRFVHLEMEREKTADEWFSSPEDVASLGELTSFDMRFAYVNVMSVLYACLLIFCFIWF